MPVGSTPWVAGFNPLSVSVGAVVGLVEVVGVSVGTVVGVGEGDFEGSYVSLSKEMSRIDIPAIFCREPP